jgi:putative serine protease PepD
VRVTSGDSTPFGSEGFGSGVVIDDQGHIITNYHVVSGSDDVTVTFADGSVVDGEVAGTDPGNDIALVKVAAGLDQLEPAALGDSDAVDVGSAVAALGNPFGLDGTFTTGVISGLDRTLTSSANGRPIRGLLQSDTAVNPGNSGGALFNLSGEVIGINTAIENPGGTGFVGVAYAVPINTPKRFMSQLVEGDTIEHPRLGIAGRSLSAEEADELGVPQGVAVLSVENGSAADDAGLEGASDGEGDVIVAIDGQPMTTFESLADYIDSKQVGDEVTLSVRRDGEDIELQATLRSWDSTA